MATRSNIVLIKVNKGGELVAESSYCHWDGYPDYNGLILETVFKKTKDIQKLVNRGEMSSISRHGKVDKMVDRGPKEIDSLANNPSLKQYAKEKMEKWGTEYLYYWVDKSAAAYVPKSWVEKWRVVDFYHPDIQEQRLRLLFSEDQLKNPFKKDHYGYKGG